MRWLGFIIFVSLSFFLSGCSKAEEEKPFSPCEQLRLKAEGEGLRFSYCKANHGNPLFSSFFYILYSEESGLLLLRDGDLSEGKSLEVTLETKGIIEQILNETRQYAGVDEQSKSNCTPEEQQKARRDRNGTEDVVMRIFAEGKSAFFEATTVYGNDKACVQQHSDKAGRAMELLTRNFALSCDRKPPQECRWEDSSN